jgi:hypothetical protein
VTQPGGKIQCLVPIPVQIFRYYRSGVFANKSGLNYQLRLL